MRFAVVLAVSGAIVSMDVRPAAAQDGAPAPEPAAEGAAPAYYEFLLGRHLGSQGDTEGALAAFGRAERLDGTSAEIPADIANLHVREDQPEEAIEAAERALRNDADNPTANRILGTIYASIAQAPQLNASQVRENALRAIAHLEKSNPEDALGVQLLLGRLYVRTQSWDRAIETLSAVLVEAPGSNDAVSLLVEAYTGAGRTADARRLLEEAGPESARLSLMLAELYEDEGRWEDAAQAYEQASRRRPRDTDLKVRWATALLNAGEVRTIDQARTVLTGIVGEEPSHARALYLLVQAERSLYNPMGAETAARRLMAVDPDSPWGPYALALVLGDRNDHAGVIESLEPVVARWADRTDRGQGLNPARLYQQLGVAYRGLGRPGEAIRQFERARAFSPEDLVLAGQHAAAYLADGQLARGVELLEAMVQGSGGRPGAYQALGELYVEAARPGDAMAVLDRAAAQHPQDASVPFGVGAALERADYVAEAEQAFQRAIAADPEHAQAFNYLGYMLIDRNLRLEESVGYIERAMELDPDNPAIIDSLGWAYFKLDRFELAETYLRRAADGLATNSVIQDHLGDTLYRLGNVDEAVIAWERALSGDGDSIDRATIERKITTARDTPPSR